MVLCWAVFPRKTTLPTWLTVAAAAASTGAGTVADHASCSQPQSSTGPEPGGVALPLSWIDALDVVVALTSSLICWLARGAASGVAGHDFPWALSNTSTIAVTGMSSGIVMWKVKGKFAPLAIDPGAVSV